MADVKKHDDVVVTHTDRSTDRVDHERTGSPNRDPITGAPGAHPVGTGIGAAGAGAVGAAIGAVAGPVGALAGAAIGSVIGGLAGKGVAEAIDPTTEDAYWRDTHHTTEYYDQNYDYDTDYAPAYKLGAESRIRHHDRVASQDRHNAFSVIENDLSRDWESSRGTSRLDWDRAKHATRDAFHRAHDRLSSSTAGSTHSSGSTGLSGSAGSSGLGTMGTTQVGSGTAAAAGSGTSSFGSTTGRSMDTDDNRPSEGLAGSGVPAGGSVNPSGGSGIDVHSTSANRYADTTPGMGTAGGAGHMGSSSPSTSAAFDDSWYRGNFNSRPYFTSSDRFEDFEPAYRYGHSSFDRHRGRRWEEVEGDLGRDWERNRGSSKLTWERAKHAVRDTWDRMTGDSGRH